MNYTFNTTSMSAWICDDMEVGLGGHPRVIIDIEGSIHQFQADYPYDTLIYMVVHR